MDAIKWVKKPINLISVLLLVLVISMGLSTSSVVGHAGDEGSKHTALYNVVDSNETATYTWFNSDYSESYKYNVEEGSEIVVDVATPDEINSEINITIGNLTRTNITDSEVDGNLGLGYYLLNAGLGIIAPTNWTEIDTAMEGFNFTT